MYFLVVTDDYSRFTWVFFLASKDETSTILKTFIAGIENLVDHKVKVIRCDNRTEFKNREMNQFCEIKEAVNNACYVQNKVLVVKPHKKIPYELFHGKSDDKADEGFFVRYSLNSKAFRVFNNRTRIVEGDLHIRHESKCKDQEKEENVNNTNNVNVAGTNGVNAVSAKTNNELPFDLKMPALEDISTYADEVA
nr:hypothetical protein [Tanacetum cinerariifolium]